VADHCGTYDLLLYLPPEIELELDTVREDDVEFQKAIDATLIQQLRANSLNYQSVSGTVAERVEQSFGSIKRILSHE
jgi:nicotinamide riboside kinase